MESAETSWAPLTALQWHRLDVTFRNTVNTFARKHPLFILNGVLMTLAPAALKPENKPRHFLFYPLEATGDRIGRDRDYPLRIVFANTPLPEIEAFTTALKAPVRNFTLVHQSPLEARSLADLARERPGPPASGDICLNFRTPLEFRPADNTRPWMLSAVELGEMLAKRVSSVFGLTLPGNQADWRQLSTLPYYWGRTELGAQSRSSGGSWRIIGNVGPLYLRGPLESVWPLLVLGSELALGGQYPGLGAYSLEADFACLTPALVHPESFLAACQEISSRHDPPEEFLHALRDPRAAASELAQAMRAHAWQPAIAQGFRVQKESGGQRLIVQLAPRDQVVHKTLHTLLGPQLDESFQPASVGYRPGYSPAAVRSRIRAAYQAGCVWALRADVEEFFDQVDWDILLAKLKALLPLADALVLELVRAAIRTPVAVNGILLPRERGLLQGSPLSPLLSNVYLGGFDEAMEERGLCLVRFGDDMLVLCHSEGEAQGALEVIRALLIPLKLRLNETKTAVLSCDTGFKFLGQTYGGGLDPAEVAEAGARRTLYLRDPGAWAGAEHDALVVRRGPELIARVPFRRLDGVVLLGAGGVSARLVERLDEWGLPLTFATAAGKPLNTLLPRDRQYLQTAAAHASRHAALTEAQILNLARRIVFAKVYNFAAWVAELPGEPARQTAPQLENALVSLHHASTLQAVRGHEGWAGAALFRFINDRAGQEWHSDNRVPGQRHDPWNSLLDFGSHLLFSRLLAIVLQRGLNPWLGLLHSPLDRYESLVYDLMEPFRCRLERFVLKLVNRQTIQLADFEPHPRGGQRLNGPAVAAFLENWERELLTRNSGDPGHLQALLEGQVLSLKSWALGHPELGLYHAAWRRHQRPPNPAPDLRAVPPAGTQSISAPPAPENRVVLAVSPKNPLIPGSPKA